MRVGFYTYADHVMGMGHVFRCLAVERALRSVLPKAEVVFELKDRPEGLRAVEKAGFKPRVWPADVVPAGPWDILFVDQLDVAPEEMRALGGRTKCLVSLDDTGLGRYEAHFAFNGLYRSRVARPSGSRTKSHEGFDYMFIDERFAQLNRRFEPIVRRVLVTQGGADTYGLVPRLIERLGPWAADRGVTLHTLVGPAFRHEAELERVVATCPRAVKIERDLRDMASFFGNMDLAVSGAGLTACELAAAGVPTLLITGEGKELETAADLATAGAALDFGLFSPAALESMVGKLTALCTEEDSRRALSQAGKNTIDGKGMHRMITLIQGADNL